MSKRRDAEMFRKGGEYALQTVVEWATHRLAIEPEDLDLKRNVPRARALDDPALTVAGVLVEAHTFIGFLRSCARSGEHPSGDQDAAIDAWFDHGYPRALDILGFGKGKPWGEA